MAGADVSTKYSAQKCGGGHALRLEAGKGPIVHPVHYMMLRARRQSGRRSRDGLYDKAPFPTVSATRGPSRLMLPSWTRNQRERFPHARGLFVAQQHPSRSPPALRPIYAQAGLPSLCPLSSMRYCWCSLYYRLSIRASRRSLTDVVRRSTRVPAMRRMAKSTYLRDYN